MTTLKYPDFKGPAKQLEDIDLPRIAHEIGAGEDEVHMLMDVESAGDGFDKLGRPKMLFEPHIFHRELTKRKDKKALAEATKLGIAYPNWKKGGYPTDSYPRMAQAMKIHPEAALMSASWGAEQMMGFNFKTAGYPDVFAMVNAHCEDEEEHIQSMINFCVENDLADDLQRLAQLTRPTTAADTAPIARVYNGAKFADNNYHTKLAAAHNKWRKIPDTAWTPESPTGPIIGAQGIDVPDLSEVRVKDIQQALKDKGYIEVGKIDGIAGKDTASAITAWQIVEGLPVDGKIVPGLYARIAASKMRPVSEARANATVKDVVESAAPPVAASVAQVNLMGNVMKGVIGVTGLGALVDGGIPDLDKLSAAVSKTQLIMNTLGDKLPWIIGLGAAGIAYYVGSDVISKIVAGYQRGNVK